MAAIIIGLVFVLNILENNYSKSTLSFDGIPVSGNAVLDCPGIPLIEVPLVNTHKGIALPAIPELLIFNQILCNANVTLIDANQGQLQILDVFQFGKFQLSFPSPN